MSDRPRQSDRTKDDALRARARDARWAGAIIAGVCVVPLIVAAVVSPSPAGFGTHRRLGMAPCGYLARTGYPCPGCGMTTSMAHMARGQVATAARVHPFGVVLFAAAIIGLSAGAAQCATGRVILRPRWWWVLVAVAVWLIGWAIKVAIGVADGTYPLGRS